MLIPKRSMLAKGVQLAIAAFACFVASAQPAADANAERKLDFTNAQTPQDCQAIVNAIRTLTDMRDIPIAEAQKSMTVRGTAAQVALAEWLFHELDKPAGARDSGKHEYQGPGDSDFVTEVLYPAHVKTAQDLQALVNAIRTTADVQRLFPYNTRMALALRATAGQAAMVEWLVNALDLPPDGRPAAPATYSYPEPPRLLLSGARNPISVPGDTVLRVYYLAHTETAQAVQEIILTIRTIADIERLFPYTTSQVVVSRTTAGQDALAEWLLNELDTPAGAAPSQNPATREYQMSGGSADIVQVFHFPNTTAQELQEITNSIRTKLSVTRIFPFTSKSALTLRGTASQVALAGQLIKERNTSGAR